MSVNDATVATPHPTDAEMNAHALADTAPSAAPPKRPWDPGRPVREFEAICAKHNLACGTPESLTAFQRALDENKSLAMNFWSVVARLGDPSHGPGLGESDILAAIVRAVTGQPIEQARESQSSAVDRLARLLAGEDLSLDPITTSAPQVPAAQAVIPEPAAAQEEAPVPSAEQQDTQRAAAPATDSRSRLVLVPDHPRTLAAAIAAAPELAQSTVQDTAPLPPAPALAATAEAAQPPIPTAVTPRARVHIQSEDEPRITIPLSAYAEQRQSGGMRAAVVILILALVGGAGYLLFRHGAAWEQSALAVIHNWTAPASPHTTLPTPSISDEDLAPAESSIPAASPRSAVAGNPTATGSSVTHSAPSSATTPRRTATRDSDAVTTAADAGRDSTLPQISADEMHDHLVSSRFPIVSDTTNADAVSGVVTLQAVVTASGSVEHIRAVSGPSQLVQPAIEAVSGWRYRPYLVNGTPSDVSTTIRVNFSGND